jgi:hypothetical protein
MLYFGEKDSNNPNEDWFKKNKTICEIIKGKGHDVYSEYNFTARICDVILNKRMD